jgi:hypothetical protein
MRKREREEKVPYKIVPEMVAGAAYNVACASMRTQFNDELYSSLNTAFIRALMLPLLEP